MPTGSIVCIGPLSKPVGGETVAFVATIKALSERPSVDVVPLSKGSSAGASVTHTLGLLWKFAIALKGRPAGVYLTAGQSLSGLLRDVILLNAAAFRRVPVVVHLHGGGLKAAYARAPRLLQRMIAHAFTRAKGLIVLSSHLADQFDFVGSMPTLHVIPNWYEPHAPILPEPGAKFADLAAGSSLHVLFLSHVLPSKGLFDLLDAVVALRREGLENIRVTFAGALIEEPGWTLSAIRSKLDDYQQTLAPPAFVMLGPVDKQEKWRLLADAHVLALPTRFVKEGQPIAILEGMYAACAVIATPYRGIIDQVQDQQTGWLIESPAELAALLRTLCGDPARVARAGTRGRAFVLDQFNPVTNLSKLVDVLLSTFKIRTA